MNEIEKLMREMESKINSLQSENTSLKESIASLEGRINKFGAALEEIIHHKGDAEQGLHNYINELTYIAKEALKQ